MRATLKEPLAWRWVLIKEEENTAPKGGRVASSRSEEISGICKKKRKPAPLGKRN